MDSQKNQFLIQMGLRFLPDTGIPCQSAGGHEHGPRPEASWEARYYWNTDRALDYVQQNVSADDMNEQLWQEGIREQDIIGVRLHRTVLLCDTCAHRLAVRWGNEPAASMAMMAAQISGTLILCLSDKQTEQTSLLSNLPASTDEKDFLRIIREQPPIDLR